MSTLKKCGKFYMKKGRYQQSSIICDTTDITIAGAKNLVMKLKTLEEIKA